MTDEVESGPSMIVMIGSHLTPALVEALRNLDVTIDMIVVRPELYDASREELLSLLSFKRSTAEFAVSVPTAEQSLSSPVDDEAEWELGLGRMELNYVYVAEADIRCDLLAQFKPIPQHHLMNKHPNRTGKNQKSHPGKTKK